MLGRGALTGRGINPLPEQTDQVGTLKIGTLIECKMQVPVAVITKYIKSVITVACSCMMACSQ